MAFATFLETVWIYLSIKCPFPPENVKIQHAGNVGHGTNYAMTVTWDNCGIHHLFVSIANINHFIYKRYHLPRTARKRVAAMRSR